MTQTLSPPTLPRPTKPSGEGGVCTRVVATGFACPRPTRLQGNATGLGQRQVGSACLRSSALINHAAPPFPGAWHARLCRHVRTGADTWAGPTAANSQYILSMAGGHPGRPVLHDRPAQAHRAGQSILESCTVHAGVRSPCVCSWTTVQLRPSHSPSPHPLTRAYSSTSPPPFSHFTVSKAHTAHEVPTQGVATCMSRRAPECLIRSLACVRAVPHHPHAPPLQGAPHCDWPALLVQQLRVWDSPCPGPPHRLFWPQRHHHCLVRP